MLDPYGGNLRCVYSGYDDMRYMLYLWWFSCLDYPFEVLISWTRMSKLIQLALPSLASKIQFNVSMHACMYSLTNSIASCQNPHRDGTPTRKQISPSIYMPNQTRHFRVKRNLPEQTSDSKTNTQQTRQDLNKYFHPRILLLLLWNFSIAST